MGLTINIPTPVLVGAGALAAGVGIGIGAEKLLEPGVAKRVEARADFESKLDDFLAATPAPDDVSVSVDGPTPFKSAGTVVLAGIAVAGVGAAMVGNGWGMGSAVGANIARGSLIGGAAIAGGGLLSHLAL